MPRYLNSPTALALLCFLGFTLLAQWRTEQIQPPKALPIHDRVVITAPVLTALFGGDRFLAANLETFRLGATAIENGRTDDFYLIRAHKVVSDLNPCHENNYYLANALLTWGGAVDEGSEILERAVECRYWDALPPFFYGFNQFFFNHNIPAAQRLLRIAANRSERNADAFRALAIMIEVEQIDDVKMAIELLKREQASTQSDNLKRKLDLRIARLEGLAVLREAAQQYKEKTGTALADPSDLITSGLLAGFPQDPMNIGYEFADGHFRLRKVKIAGLGER